MKKLILLAAFFMLGITANAQSTPQQIDTTDATIKYLLDRIEALEHKVNFEQDQNALYFLSHDLANVWDDIRTERLPKRTIKELIESYESRRNVLVKRISFFAVRYSYTDEELSVLDSLYKTIDLRLEQVHDWLDK